MDNISLMKASILLVANTTSSFLVSQVKYIYVVCWLSISEGPASQLTGRFRQAGQ